MASHVLDISHYSFKEILQLFDLDYTIEMEDLKRAKKKVLMSHPDKSRLPPEYFLFYKKAFDVVVDYYKSMNKQNQPIPEKCSYEANHSGVDDQISNQVKSAIQKMGAKDFHSKFNTVFEQTIQRRVDPAKNQWFSSDDPALSHNETVTKSNMGEVFDRVKEKQQANAVTRYTGVTHLYSSGGTNFYEEIEEDNDEYLTADIFSKLKFDDIRRVHKDQTVFSVSERDYQNVPKYNSVDDFTRSRDSVDLTPLEKARAEQILAEENRIKQERLQNKMYKINVLNDTYTKKSSEALSSFLLLK